MQDNSIVRAFHGVVDKTQVAQRLFIFRRQGEMVDPLKKVRPGFRAHPLGQRLGKGIPGQESVNALAQKSLGSKSQRPIKLSRGAGRVRFNIGFFLGTIHIKHEKP